LPVAAGYLELIINLKSAKALTISESFLLRPDEVIAMPLS